MTKGKVVLVPFPFDDLSTTKVRPALCLTDPVGAHRHVVVAFITSQLPTVELETDYVMEATSEKFSATGLRVTSTIRLHRLMTVTTSIILRELGSISTAVQAELDEKLRRFFKLAHR